MSYLIALSYDFPYRLIVTNANFLFLGCFLTNKKSYLISLAAPYALLFVFCCHRIPESPAWLQEKGRTDEALEILHSMAQGNGSELPHNFTLLPGEPTYVEPSSSRNLRVGLNCI